MVRKAVRSVVAMVAIVLGMFAVPSLARGGLAENSDACGAKCPTGGVNGFSPSLFKFVTVIADDGKGKGGGWQEASVTLKFVRLSGLLPDAWTCPIKVGMPLRTKENGQISAEYAASISAAVADAASSLLMHGSTELPRGIFCSKLPETMTTLFGAKYSSIGARVTKS